MLVGPYPRSSPPPRVSVPPCISTSPARAPPDSPAYDHMVWATYTPPLVNRMLVRVFTSVTDRLKLTPLVALGTNPATL
ncbi:MAG: hypothetical protein BWY79_02014 [Actinobacteria bacterium ADurb.Bin444]|nr:MAG: hypothetical protein BWY79_02014 [Actinobacteria bacterium ADurb.Bin444]